MTTYPFIYGVRHLSPACSFHLKQCLNELKPTAVLVEGFCDATDHINSFMEIKPPFAILSYTEEAPVKSVLLPFSEYSPEYVAIRYALENKVYCEFIDLPSSVFLALPEHGLNKDGDENNIHSIYEEIAELSDFNDYDNFWEHTFEHELSTDKFIAAIKELGITIREKTLESKERIAESLIREAFMRKKIEETINKGYASDKIIVITGAYHMSALNNMLPIMTDAEYEKLPKLKSKTTLMPYTYFKLSTLSGYGAGNKAPEYYHMMYEKLLTNNLPDITTQYLSSVAKYIRDQGSQGSTAQVIDAVTLANALSNLRNSTIPSLSDLKDSAIVCLGNGEYSKISEACAYYEIGTRIGSVPEGVSRTSIQDDFYRELKRLKLEKYKSVIAEDLDLDLRENRNVKSNEAAYLDLHRSFFLHRLKVLNIPFQEYKGSNQNKATWAEKWILKWSPEAEIALVESILKGETIEIACAHAFKEALNEAISIKDASKVIWNACLCGMPEWLCSAAIRIDEMMSRTDSFSDIADSIGTIANTITYGDIRQFSIEPLKPMLEKLYVKASLSAYESSKCNDAASNGIIEGMSILNSVSREHYNILDTNLWMDVVKELSDRDDINPKVSGYACTLLIINNQIDNENLEKQVSRRLSPGVPPDLGAGWFEGLCMGNRYALLSRLILWESVDKYISNLDEEQFRKALVFLRRALSTFEVSEKLAIYDNLSEIWNISSTDTGDILSRELTEDEKKTLDELQSFDFDF